MRFNLPSLRRGAIGFLVLASLTSAACSTSRSSDSTSTSAVVEVPVRFTELLRIGKDKVREGEEAGKPYERGRALFDDIFKEVERTGERPRAEIESFRERLEKLAPEGDVGLISVDRVLARLERMRVAEEAGGDVNVALRDLTSNVEAELASLLGEPTRPFERDALAYMRDHEPTQPILEDIKNIFEKGQTEGWFKDPQDAVMAKRIFELMSGPEFDKAFAREIGDWAEWIELHAKEYPNLDTATQAYFEKWAKTEGYGLYTVQGSLTPEQFARGFKSPDGKINIIGRDLGFQNTPMTTTDRTSGHQQLIHFFETAALVRLDKPATTRLFDSMGEFRYNGRLQYKLGPTNDSSATVWGVLFDAFNTGAPFTPEATSPAIQNVYVKLIPKFYR